MSRKRPSRKSSKHITITLDDMAHGGSALGKHQGRTIFVPYTIPGETVQARIRKAQSKSTHAEGIKLLEASADRVFPQCAHFGPRKCWRCHWQHIDYSAQLLLKQDVFADQLSRLGKLSDKVIERVLQPLIPSPQQWNYNYHMTLERTPEGILGFKRADRSVQKIIECHLLHPTLLSLYDTLDLDFDGMIRLKLQIDNLNQTMLTLTMNNEELPELAANFSTSVNVILPDNEPLNLIGDSHLRYTIAERDFRVTAGTFIRANVPMIESLIGEILKALDLSGKEQVLDLYAGVGITSAFIAPRARLVTLVESFPPAATDADENLSDFGHVDVVEGSVQEVLASIAESGEGYDAVVVDPPGRGIDRETLKILADLQIPRIIYVSSDPAALARDGRQLVKQGYYLTHVQPLDFDPQTYYSTSVATFELASHR